MKTKSLHHPSRGPWRQFAWEKFTDETFVCRNCGNTFGLFDDVSRDTGWCCVCWTRRRRHF